MKYNLELRLYLAVFSRFLNTDPVLRDCRREIRTEYRRILLRAGEIGPGNPLLSSYALGALFLAVNRCGPHSPEENYRLIDGGLRRSHLMRLALGDADHYLSEKRFQKRLLWSERTHRREYPNDWVVDVLPGCEDYDLGYDYRACGVCCLFRDEGCPELAQYLCRLDFTLADIMGLTLRRTSTLAQGGDLCDFRFSRKKQE